MLIMPVRPLVLPSVRMSQLETQWKDLEEIWFGDPA
jgi:hypothetical protein